MNQSEKAKIDRLLALLAKSSAQMNNFELRLAREAAGLSLGQAAGMMKLLVQELRELEDQYWEADKGDSTLVADFDRIYGLGA